MLEWNQLWASKAMAFLQPPGNCTYTRRLSPRNSLAQLKNRVFRIRATAPAKHGPGGEVRPIRSAALDFGIQPSADRATLALIGPHVEKMRVNQFCVALFSSLFLFLATYNGKNSSAFFPMPAREIVQCQVLSLGIARGLGNCEVSFGRRRKVWNSLKIEIAVVHF